MDTTDRPAWPDCSPAFRIITDSELGNNAVEIFPCQVCHGFSRKLERANFHNGILMIPRSRAVRLRLMSLTGTEIARLNDKVYRELLSARLEEERRIQIFRRIKERELEELDRKTKLNLVSSSSEDEAASGEGAITRADNMVPEQLKQYLCLDPDEVPTRKRSHHRTTESQQGSIQTPSHTNKRGKDLQESSHLHKKHPVAVRGPNRTQNPRGAQKDEADRNAAAAQCRCRSTEECPVVARQRNNPGVSTDNRNCDGEGRLASTKVGPNEVILPHETHRLLSSSAESDDLRGKLDAIQDLDTLYNLADRLLLPPLQFDGDAQEEEPMKLSILENAVFDGNAEENLEEMNSDGEVEDFVIF